MAKKVIKMVLDTDLNRYGMKPRSFGMGFSHRVLSVNEKIAQRLVSEGRAEFFERKPKRFVNIISGGKTETVTWGEYLKRYRR
jgi:hypothetical protein